MKITLLALMMLTMFIVSSRPVTAAITYRYTVYLDHIYAAEVHDWDGTGEFEVKVKMGSSSWYTGTNHQLTASSHWIGDEYIKTFSFTSYGTTLYVELWEAASLFDNSEKLAYGTQYISETGTLTVYEGSTGNCYATVHVEFTVDHI